MGSFVPWGSLSLGLFLLLQSMLHLSSGCSVEESTALLEIRSSLTRARSLVALDSWGKDGHDCCSWERVKCNNRTQRVSHLDLSSVYATLDGDDRWYLNSTVLSVFHELQYLDLSNNAPCSLSLEGMFVLKILFEQYVWVASYPPDSINKYTCRVGWTCQAPISRHQWQYVGSGFSRIYRRNCFTGSLGAQL
jgi:hypothetical protein